MTRNSKEKLCPECGESVKAAARICRFCRYEFTDQTRPERHRSRPWLLLVLVGGLFVALAVGLALFLVQGRGDFEYESVSEIVQTLEAEGVSCGSNSGVLSDPPGPERERILCRYDTPNGFSVAMVESGETDDLLEFFRSANEEMQENIIAAGSDPLDLPETYFVIGPNWVVSTPDSSLAGDIRSILKGRLDTLDAPSQPSSTPTPSLEPIESESPAALGDSACVSEGVCFYVGQATADLVGVEFAPESHGIFGSSEFASCLEQLSALMDRVFNLDGDADTSYLQEPLVSQANGLMQLFSRQEWPEASLDAAEEVVSRCGELFGTSLD